MKKIIFPLLISILLASCTENRTAVLWSDSIEAADITEIYNGMNGQYKILFHYKENLLEEYHLAEEKPDLIIGANLLNYRFIDEMAGLDGILDKNEKKGFFIEAPFLKETRYRGETKLLPLSYSLSAAVFKKDSKRVDSSLPALELDKMRELAIAFNDGSSKAGFSPAWDDAFLYCASSLLGSNFSSGPEGQLLWNKEGLKAAETFLAEWHRRNGELDDFNNKYLYENRVKLIEDERILFTTMNSSDYMKLTDNVKRSLDLLYISHNNRLHPENIIYGAYGKKSNGENIAVDFLTWLANPANQEKAIKSAQINKTGGFGFLGGFSTIDTVNCSILPKYYPQLTGSIPEGSYLLDIDAKPANFYRMRYDLITKWFKHRISGGEKEFDYELENWEKLQILP